MPSGNLYIVNEAPVYTTLRNVTPLQSTEYFGSICGMNAIIPSDELKMEVNRLSLEIIEQPASTFRYRYKSEKGSHGGIKGANSLNPRAKKSFPAVKLENCPLSWREKIVIQVSLYTNEPKPKPHVYELTGKNCSEGKCETTLNENFVAEFPSLAISTKKKEEALEILKQRKSLEYDSDEKPYDEDAVEVAAQEELKGINLDSVKLCFQAFFHDDRNTPLCDKVFSNHINNQKSAASGDLKICHLSRYSGKCSGGDEVTLLCEKVNKDNIKVRFFEDPSEDSYWEGYGEFNSADVHHQYAIVFKTPEYRQTNVRRRVYIELVRSSGGKPSDPRPFDYIPDVDALPPSRKSINLQTSSFIKNEIAEIGRKRKRLDLDTDTIGHESFLGHSSLMDSPQSIDEEQYGSLEFTDNPNIDEHLYKLFPDLLELFNETENATVENQAMEGVAECDLFSHGQTILNQCFQGGNLVVADSIMDEISNSMDSLSLGEQSGKQELNSPKMQKASKDFMDGMNKILQNRVIHYASHLIPMEDENRNSMLHIAIQEESENLNLIIEMLQRSSENLINHQNKFQKTPLHLAVQGNHLKIFFLLLIEGGDPNIQDIDGNNCLHLSAKYGLMDFVKLLMLPSERKWKREITDINVLNNDGMSALHIAITRNFEDIVNFLLKSKADVNLPERTWGRTSLHLAVEHPLLLQTILKQPELDINAQDFRGYTGAQLACIKTGKSFEVISAQLKDSKEKTIQFFESINWNETVCGAEEGSDGQSSDSSDFEDAVEDFSSISCNEVIHKTVPVTKEMFRNEKKSCLMKTEEELQKYLDMDENWKKLAILIDLDTEGVAIFDKGLSPGSTVLKKFKDLYHPCDQQAVIEFLRLADLEEGVQILQKNT